MLVNPILFFLVKDLIKNYVTILNGDTSIIDYIKNMIGNGTIPYGRRGEERERFSYFGSFARRYLGTEWRMLLDVDCPFGG